MIIIQKNHTNTFTTKGPTTGSQHLLRINSTNSQ
jgi:hypothetical protein